MLDVADDIIKLLSPLINSKVIETFRTELEMLIRDAEPAEFSDDNAVPARLCRARR